MDKMSKIWKQAQTIEAQEWIEMKESILSPEYRNNIRKRSKRVEKWVNKFIEIKADLNILEIGGGATQMIDFFGKGNKYAVDPLADFYMREFSGILYSDVSWFKSKVEEMPYKNDFFDIIIMRNVLDHVDSASMTLSEIRRVLKKGGVVYLGLNTFSGLLFVYKHLVKDKCHPFTFSPKNIKFHIKKAGFTIKDAIYDDPENMSHFSDMLATTQTHKVIVRNIFLCLKFYHFSEFLLKKKLN